MAFENTWVTYLQRSYKSIKASILARMEIEASEITDRSESNIFVIIVSAFAGLVEQLNYYIDNMARELYLPTARRYSSLVKITRLIDYRVRAKIGSTVDLKVTAVDSGGIEINVTSNVTISSGAIIKTTGNIEFITTRERTIPIGNSSVSIPAKQRKLFSNQDIGNTTSNPNQAFKLDADYEHNTLQITINNQTWELRQTFSFSGPKDRHFIVEVNEAKEAYVVFGDNINGVIPLAGYDVLATFYKCLGLLGNVIADTISTWVNGKPTGGGAFNFLVTNPYPASGGVDVEDSERIRKHAPLSLRTLDRAVTLQDHIDIALLTPGVGKVSVEFNYNLKGIYVYVSPDGGGVASSGLLTSVEDYLYDKKMISTFVEAKAVGLTYLRISLVATAKFRRSGSDTKTDIINALLTYFGFNYSDINKDIRKSDIIALIDNLDKVDYLALTLLTHRPYPKVTNGTNDLDPYWYANVMVANTSKVNWRLRVVTASSRSARLYRIDPNSGDESLDSIFTYSAADPGQPTLTADSGEIQIGFYGTFNDGDEWEFTSYPYNEDIIFDDYTIPITRLSDLDITVTEQLI
jgi:hypothetical protein